MRFGRDDPRPSAHGLAMSILTTAIPAEGEPLAAFSSTQKENAATIGCFPLP